MASNSNLKSSVSGKLIHFLGDFNYTPDSIRVLTEYVLVLVSNGKCQSEAKAELEPFLGDITTEFVSWLWGILSENSYDPNANMSSFGLENITGRSSSEADDASINSQSQKSGSGSIPHCQFPIFSNTLAEETNENASALSCKSNENLRAFENNQYGSLSGRSFKTKPSDEILLPHEQNVQYEKVHRRSPPFKYSEETNVGGRRLFSRAAGAIFLQKGINGITRVNVWDRLGKLTENDTSVKVQENESVNMKRQVLEHNSLGFGQNTLITTVQDGKFNQNLSQNCNVKTYRSNGGRKRQLNDCVPISSTSSDTQDREKEKSRKFMRQPENYTCTLKEGDASCKSEKSKSCNKGCKSDFDAAVSCRPEKASKEKLGVEALESTQTLISDSAFPAATRGIGPVQAQLVDMKLRLHKLETEISKLRLKSLNKDGNHALSSSFGSVDPLKEGVEWRTVFVTNVGETNHF